METVESPALPDGYEVPSLIEVGGFEELTEGGGGPAADLSNGYVYW